MRVLERVRAESVRAYCDLRSFADKERDVPAETRTLGDFICQVHLRNRENLLSQPDEDDA